MDHSVDTDAVLETAYEYGRTGTREERYEQVTALEETPVEYTLSAEMGEASLRAALETMTASLNTEPKDASVTAFNAGTEQFDIADGTDGVTVDLDALTADVKAQIENSGSGTVQIPVTLTPCSISADDLRQNLKKLGTYSTTCHEHGKRQLQHGARHGLDQRHVRAAGRDVLLFRRGGPRRA